MVDRHHSFFKPVPSQAEQQKKSCDLLRAQFDNVVAGRPVDERAIASLETSRKDLFSLSVQTNCQEVHFISNQKSTFNPSC